MKTKSILLTCLFALFASVTLSAQSIVKGDMNDDNEVTIADVTSVVNVVLGKSPLETISAGCSCEPYMVDNSSVVGSWSTPNGTSFQFNEDGTTTFPSGATYEFMPMQGRLIVYDTDSQPVKVIPLLKIESEKILTVDYSTNTFTYFTKLAPAVTYYWYAGQTQPTSMNSNPEVDDTSFTANKWHTLGTATTIAKTITGGTSGLDWYVAVPTEVGLKATATDLSTPDTSWDNIGTITINSISYTLWRPNITGTRCAVYMAK